jgi:uncharacterized phage protein gp47/JayE
MATLLPPAIDYTNKDYTSLRQAMLDLARYRLPEWTDLSPSDPGVLLVDLFAYMGDIILYYQDRIASEMFLHTSAERRSVLNHLRLIGYELTPAMPASASIALTFNAPAQSDTGKVTVPNGAQFATKPNGSGPQTFEYLGPDLVIDLRSAQVQPGAAGKVVFPALPVVHSQTVKQVTLGSSTSEANLNFRVPMTPLTPGTILVEVNEGAGFVPWDARENLLYFTGDDGRVTLSGPTSRDFMVRWDEDGVAWVVFGDGVYGAIPPRGNNNIRASFRIGGGAVGNVPAGAISDPKTKIAGLASVANPLPAAGGVDPETADHAVNFGPLAFRSGNRAVTLNDFVSLAQRAGGVAKVRARSLGWNLVELYVAPQGDVLAPTPSPLQQRLIDFFEDKRMVGTFVQIKNAIPVKIDIHVDLVVEHNFDPALVQDAALKAVQSIVAFANVDFGQPLYLSKVYDAIEGVTGVLAANVTRFRRADRAATLSLQIRQLPASVVKAVPDLLDRLLNVDVETDGRIEIGDQEIAVPGAIDVALQGVLD